MKVALPAVTAVTLSAAAFVALWSTPSEACGCFAPPDPSVPVVQAGERIVFAAENGEVTAHIQISYEGPAQEFGWLLPLPAVPNLELGTDELFNVITTTTQPKYVLTRKYEGNCTFDPSRFALAPGAVADGENAAGGAGGGSSPLVIQDSVGPYDYAVLKADAKDEMLQWLKDNRYFIPTGTEDAVGPYIRPGAYFLALKLRSGKSTGDLQPVVLHYQSDLPMIPLVLTSVAAKPDMGIQVWMLGEGRAIPRNYYHTVINDALLDWNSGASNYNDVIIAATKEAPGRHTFVTEYAGKSDVMKNQLDFPGRFGVESELAAQPGPTEFVEYLWQHNYATGTQTGFFTQFNFPATLVTLLQANIPVPAALAAKGVTANEFYSAISYYLGSYRNQNPGDFTNYTIDYQPAEMAKEIFERVVTPTKAASAMFDAHPYLTRMYTTLSPEDMNKDPVFSFNKSLPDWSNVHTGTLTYHCGLSSSDPLGTSATLVTESGYKREFSKGVGSTFTPPSQPASLRIEVLAEEGSPLVVTDNAQAILGSAGGCSSTGLGGPMAGALLALAFLWRRTRAKA